MENFQKKIFVMLLNLLLFSAFIAPLCLHAQPVNETYAELYTSGEYKKSLDIIISRINDIYSKRVNDKRIPEEYLPLDRKKNEDSEKNKKVLMALFNNRKAKGFFIEDNLELADLHLYAGKCYFKLNKKYDSLNHLIQSLRYRNITTDRDDEVYYQIAQNFKILDSSLYFKAYIDALEQAYSLNSSRYEYSYELGTVLYSTSDKKRAIFHFEKYLSLSGKEDADVFLKLASLYEGLGKYIECEKYYNEYVRLRPDDIKAMFAVGYIAYYRTGNYTLAEFMLQGVLNKAPEGEIYLISKSNEYLGDMSLSNLKYDKAISYYNNMIESCHKIENALAVKRTEKGVIDNKINELKMNLLNNKNSLTYDEYDILLDEYQRLTDEQGDKAKDIQNIEYLLRQLNPGKGYWNMAVSYEKTGNYTEAINFYQLSIKYSYNTDKARGNIEKLQLKIKRGY